MDIHSVKQIIEMLERRLNKAQDRYESAQMQSVQDIRFGGVVELQQALLEAKDMLNAELIARDLALQLEMEPTELGGYQ